MYAYKMQSRGVGDESFSMTLKKQPVNLSVCIYLNYKIVYAESINFFWSVSMGSLVPLATYFMGMNGM